MAKIVEYLVLARQNAAFSAAMAGKNENNVTDQGAEMMGCLSPTRWPVIIGCQQPQATTKDRRETKILEKGPASGMAPG